MAIQIQYTTGNGKPYAEVISYTSTAFQSNVKPFTTKIEIIDNV